MFGFPGLPRFGSGLASDPTRLHPMSPNYFYRHRLHHQSRTENRVFGILNPTPYKISSAAILKSQSSPLAVSSPPSLPPPHLLWLFSLNFASLKLGFITTENLIFNWFFLTIVAMYFMIERGSSTFYYSLLSYSLKFVNFLSIFPFVIQVLVFSYFLQCFLLRNL